MAAQAIKITGLTRRDYFSDVVRIMHQKQFLLFSCLEISSDDLPYCESVTYARHTMFFFRLKAKALIIQMEYREDDKNSSKTGRMKGCWHIHLYHQQLSPPILLSLLEKDFPQSFSKKLAPKLPLIDHAPIILPGFQPYSTYRWGELESRYKRSRLPEHDLLPAIKSLADAIYSVLKYLNPQFSRLTVTNFPPRSHFPGSEGLFWKKFNYDYLSSFVKVPEGYKS